MTDEKLTVKWEKDEWRILTDTGFCLYRSMRKAEAIIKARTIAAHGGWKYIHIWRMSGNEFESVQLKS